MAHFHFSIDNYVIIIFGFVLFLFGLSISDECIINLKFEHSVFIFI